MLDADPTKRITLQQILNHEFFLGNKNEVVLENNINAINFEQNNEFPMNKFK